MRILLLCFLVTLCSCSDEVLINKFEMLKLGQKVAPDIEVILPKSIGDGIKCTDYKDRNGVQLPGCISGRYAKLRKVKIIVVEFDSKENARKAAIEVDQYYAHNWLFDDVTDEPVLESFVEEAYNAKRPLIHEKKK
jgi:hypothetical protein